jgi:imidazolonepropionase-like amidohydrolase
MNMSASFSATLSGFFVSCILFSPALAQSPPPSTSGHAVVLRAARLLEIESGKIITPGEVLVQGERIAEVGSAVKRPAGAEVIDLGDSTLMPGLIDAHVHLFLHPGAEDLQTVQESVPQRTISAVLAARDDLMAGFTAERDMGTEGAGSADTAVRNAINQGSIPGPRMRISGNAVDILGGHEDAIRYNPTQHIFSNATYANNAAELVTVIRQQLKEGADFIRSTKRVRTHFARVTFPRPISIRKPSSERLSRKPPARASASRSTRRVSRARCTPRGPAWPPSITPIN